MLVTENGVRVYSVEGPVESPDFDIGSWDASLPLHHEEHAPALPCVR